MTFTSAASFNGRLVLSRTRTKRFGSCAKKERILRSPLLILHSIRGTAWLEIRSIPYFDLGWICSICRGTPHLSYCANLRTTFRLSTRAYRNLEASPAGIWFLICKEMSFWVSKRAVSTSMQVIGDKFFNFFPQLYTFKMREISEGGNHPFDASSILRTWLQYRTFRFRRHDNQAHYAFFVGALLLIHLYALGLPPKLAFLLF